MSNNTGDRLTHHGIEVVFVRLRDTSDLTCHDCPFVGGPDLPDMCYDAPCHEGILLTVPDYVTWRLTK